MRKEIKNQEQLERYLASREKSCDLKALVLKMVVKIGDVKEVSQLTGIALSTIYEWIKQWNKRGELESHRGEGGGRKAKLSEENREKLKKLLEGKEGWTTKEVKELIEREFGVRYTSHWVRRILRKLG